MKIGLVAKNDKFGWVHDIPYARMWELLRTTGEIEKRQPLGSGTSDDPFRPLFLENWYWLATREYGQESMYLWAGGRKIVRWGRETAYFVGYTSDVTGLDRADFSSADAFFLKAKEEAEKFDGPETDPNWPVYAKKAHRLAAVDSPSLVRESRRVIRGQALHPATPVELANTVAGLLIAEPNPHRTRPAKKHHALVLDGQHPDTQWPPPHAAPEIFRATLMLLDLIEREIPYGRNNQKYTFASLLMHNDKPSGKPHVGYIEGRTPRIAPQEQRQLAKHPMAGAGTVKLGQSLLGIQTPDRQLTGQVTLQPNAVRHRVISIASVWAAHYLNNVSSLNGGTGRYALVLRTPGGLDTINWKAKKGLFQHRKQASEPTGSNAMWRARFGQQVEQHIKSALQYRAWLTVCMLEPADHTPYDWDL